MLNKGSLYSSNKVDFLFFFSFADIQIISLSCMFTGQRAKSKDMSSIMVIFQTLSEQQYLGDAGNYFSHHIHIRDKVNGVTQ